LEAQAARLEEAKFELAFVKVDVVHVFATV
jgi:hypothetical protein